MTLDEFWQLHEALPLEDPAEVLTQRLSRLDAAAVLAFNRHQTQCFMEAYSWDLWGAAYLIDGGCSDDGFMDFRFGLMARGRQVFEAAVRQPDTLAQVMADESDEAYIPNEDMGHVADRAYRALTGQDLPPLGLFWPEQPHGTEWDFDDEAMCRAKLPALWAKHMGTEGGPSSEGHPAGTAGAPSAELVRLIEQDMLPTCDNRTGRRVGG